MDIKPELTDSAIVQILGERIGRTRIETGLTQAELAERAGIGKRTVERIEAGRGAEIITLIRILRTLNALEGLERLLPELPPSPIAQLKLRGKQRLRVSHPRGRADTLERPNPVKEGVQAKPWTWATAHTQDVPRAKGSRPPKRKV